MNDLTHKMSHPQVIADAAAKREAVRTWLDKKGLDGVVLSRRDSFAWITCGGDNRVLNSSETGVGHIVITRNAHYLVAYYMDADRLLDEQVPGQGYELITVFWYEGDEREKARTLAGKNVGADSILPGTININAEIKDMQWPLTEIELERTRWIGQQQNELIRNIFREVKIGMTEIEIQNMLHYEINQRGMDLDVPILGSDERIFKYRHILPTNKKIEHYLMVGPVVSRWGLHGLVSRSLYFGEPPMDLIKAFRIVATIQGRLISSLHVGLKFRTILEWQKKWYEELGVPNGWTYHFQGGPTGYSLVDSLQNQTENVLRCPQPYSWFTTVKGAKVEELSILTDKGPEIASMDENWPKIVIETENGKIQMPGIMIR